MARRQRLALAAALAVALAAGVAVAHSPHGGGGQIAPTGEVDEGEEDVEAEAREAKRLAVDTSPVDAGLDPTFRIPAARCDVIAEVRGQMDGTAAIDKCSLCEQIVKNGARYPAALESSDLSQLCEGVPPHLEEQCAHYVCRLASCPEFKSKTCKQAPRYGMLEQFNPCLPKYVCWHCLGIPQRHVRGCFEDMFNDGHA